jgi:beta-phosphoglucomutase-like phosphatase (HAD superfamily)
MPYRRERLVLSPADRRPPGLVIFDCDGVLVETEPGETLAILDVAHRYGYDASVDEAVRRFRGLKLAEVQAHVERRVGRGLPPSFIAEVRERCAATVDTCSLASPGVADALRALRADTCVASSSPADVVRTRLRAAGLLAFFRHRVFSAYDVGVWKPDPGLFLAAAAACGYEPAGCVVVEDSAVGVEAAIAAEMRVILYEPVKTPLSDRLDVTVIRHMADLVEAVTQFRRTPANG